MKPLGNHLPVPGNKRNVIEKFDVIFIFAITNLQTTCSN